jgi:hypothetical protein
LSVFESLTTESEVCYAHRRPPWSQRWWRSANSKKKPEPRKPARRRSKSEDEALALAEELLRASRRDQAAFVAGWDKFLKELGIRGKPIGAKKLREQLLAKGFDPQGNEFSQGIIAMREE